MDSQAILNTVRGRIFRSHLASSMCANLTQPNLYLEFDNVLLFPRKDLKEFGTVGSSDGMTPL